MGVRRERQCIAARRRAGERGVERRSGRGCRARRRLCGDRANMSIPYALGIVSAKAGRWESFS